MQFTSHAANTRLAPAATPRAASGWTHSSKLLWTIQGVLAAIFLFAGAMKLVLPIADLQGGSVEFPALFLRFIGVCEVAGALGLVLPGVLRIRLGLTPLAAAGLVVIMIGATVVTIVDGDIAPALMPAVVGALAAFIAFRRSASVRS